MWNEIKARFFKYDAIHGLYKIPLGLVLIYIAVVNVPPQYFHLDTIGQLVQFRYILHLIAALIGARALFEGLHDLFHNPVKRADKLDMAVMKLRQKRYPIYTGDHHGLNQAQQEIDYYDKTGVPPVGGIVGTTNIAPYIPVGICVGSDNKNWIVCGDTNLLRQESLTNNDVTVFDLGAVVGPSELPDPCRIRNIGGLLYMPCMTANGIIIYTPGAPINTAVWKGGFEGPMDVVSTGSKVFAVQNSPVGLKEIV